MSGVKKKRKTFGYNVYEDTGNDDVKHFSVKLSIDEKVIAKARATSKKKAEEKASKRAFFAFQRKCRRCFNILNFKRINYNVLVSVYYQD